MYIHSIIQESYTNQSNLVNMNSRGPSKLFILKRNFTITSCISVIMPGDFKVVRIKQVFHFNSVHINEVPLFTGKLRVSRQNGQ